MAQGHVLVWQPGAERALLRQRQEVQQALQLLHVLRAAEPASAVTQAQLQLRQLAHRQAAVSACMRARNNSQPRVQHTPAACSCCCHCRTLNASLRTQCTSTHVWHARVVAGGLARPRAHLYRPAINAGASGHVASGLSGGSCRSPRFSTARQRRASCVTTAGRNRQARQQAIRPLGQDVCPDGVLYCVASLQLHRPLRR